MRLSIERLDLQNFKRFSGKLHFNLRLGFGLHFIRGRNNYNPRGRNNKYNALGSNGASKSSLFDAVSWCLYGRTPAGLRTPDIRPWQKTNGSTYVAVVVYCDDDRHHIMRHANPNELMLDEREATQEDIDKLMGMSFDVFTHTILLGQERPLFFDLTPSEKMDIFATLEGLDRWDARIDQASAITVQVSEEIQRIERLIDGNKRTANELGASRDRLKQDSDAWEKDVLQVVERGDQELAKLRKQEETLTRKHAEADLAYDSASTEHRACERELDELIQKHREAQTILTDMQFKLRSERAFVTSRKEELQNFGSSDECPVCGSTPKHDSKLRKHRAQLKREIAQFEKSSDGVARQVAGQEHIVSAINTQIEINRAARGDFLIKLNKARDNLDALTPQLSNLKFQIVNLQRNVEEAREKHNPFRDELQTIRKRTSQMNEKIEQYAEQLKLKERKRERAQYWATKGFKDIKLHIIEDTLQELELCSNAMLEQNGLVDWQIKYTIEKETKKGTKQRGLHVLVSSPDSPKFVRWESWSGGERQRCRLIGSLALSEVLLEHAGVVSEIEILDEPTQHLSDEGVRDLTDMLADRARSLGRAIFYIDQQSIESSRFRTVTTITRDTRGVSIETQA